MCVCAPDSESVCPSKHVDTDTTHAQRCPDEILGRFPRPVRASSERSYTMDATLFSLGAPKYCLGGGFDPPAGEDTTFLAGGGPNASAIKWSYGTVMFHAACGWPSVAIANARAKSAEFSVLTTPLCARAPPSPSHRLTAADSLSVESHTPSRQMSRLVSPSMVGIWLISIGIPLLPKELREIRHRAMQCASTFAGAVRGAQEHDAFQHLELRTTPQWLSVFLPIDWVSMEGADSEHARSSHHARTPPDLAAAQIKASRSPASDAPSALCANAPVGVLHRHRRTTCHARLLTAAGSPARAIAP